MPIVDTSPPSAVIVNEPLRVSSPFRVSVSELVETASVPCGAGEDEGEGEGFGLGGCVDRPGVGDDSPRGEELDGPEAEAEAEGDTVMVRPACWPPLPLP